MKQRQVLNYSKCSDIGGQSKMENWEQKQGRMQGREPVWFVFKKLRPPFHLESALQSHPSWFNNWQFVVLIILKLL